MKVHELNEVSEFTKPVICFLNCFNYSDHTHPQNDHTHPILWGECDHVTILFKFLIAIN